MLVLSPVWKNKTCFVRQVKEDIIMKHASLVVAITMLLFAGSTYAGGYMQRMPDGSYLDSDGGYHQRMPDGSFSGPGGYQQRMPDGSYSTPDGYMQRMPDGSYSY
jgi:hypothetical protein